MMRRNLKKYVKIILTLVIICLFTNCTNKSNTKLYSAQVLDFTKADNVTGFDHFIVPNILHIIHFGKPELSFTELITIRSAYLNHKFDNIYFHCDCYKMSGKLWDMVQNIPGIEVMYKAIPIQIFGKNISYIQHASDVARIEVLLKYGGIYLDSDVYVVKSLDMYRKFEFTLGWPLEEYMGSQVLIAHKDARFLKLYYESYRNYHPDLWYYNAGQFPTTSILHQKPYLVHREPYVLGVNNHSALLYEQLSDEWRNFTTIHLLIRHTNVSAGLDLEKIKTYNRTFGVMARLVL